MPNSSNQLLASLLAGTSPCWSQISNPLTSDYDDNSKSPIDGSRPPSFRKAGSPPSSLFKQVASRLRWG